jgi:uncharacterized protein (TIGR00369 family)
MQSMSTPPVAFGVVEPATALRTDGLTFLRNMIARQYPSPPFAESTDIWLTMAEHGRVLFEGLPTQRYLNPLGTIHGGWISTLLDSAMGCAVHSTLKPGHGFTTVDMTVSFVRPASPNSGKLICEGKIIHSGGRIATAQGRVTDATGKLIAHGTETCLILKAPATNDGR